MRRLVVILVVLSTAGCRSQTTQVEEDVRRSLRDPESAQFRDVRACPQPKAYRGEVNAKNAYGGFVGFTEFFWVDGEVSVMAASSSSPEAELAAIRAHARVAAKCVDGEEKGMVDGILKRAAND